MTVMIQGGRIITATDEFVADVFVNDGHISAIGESLPMEAQEVIDARGKWLLPGGVDPHTHVDAEIAGLVEPDDFTSGTVAAAFGGTTTIVDFCLQRPGQSLPEALEGWHTKLERAKPVVDVGFHLAITDLGAGGGLSDLERVPDNGVTSFKLFMAYRGAHALMVNDETLFKAMQVAADTGAIVMVHAENGSVIDVLTDQALAEGKTEPKYHALTRPPLTEGEATHRAIALARVAGAPLYVVHVSCREALEPIARARAENWRTWGETCTQYLFIDESDLEEPNFEGAKYVFTPPPRPKEHQEHLWHALATNTLSVVASDHGPWMWSQKQRGRNDFSRIPYGVGTIEHRLHMLHHYGVREGRISANRFVDLVSTAPAKLFGLYPRKGTIAVGSDADLVVFNPTKPFTISAATHHSKVDYTPFEGHEVVGTPEVVLLRGQIVVADGKLAANPGVGEFVRRARFGESLTSGRTPRGGPVSVSV